MKLIGLLGGTSWPSTFEYYQLLNRLASQRLGGYHSARILLKSIDYHEIKSSYNDGWGRIPGLLKQEIKDFLPCKPDCLILCNNTLHKAYDLIADELEIPIPFFHAVDLAAEHAKNCGYSKLLLLATKFTMEDSFYRSKIEAQGIKVTIPDETERQEIQSIQTALASGIIKDGYRNYFQKLISKYADNNAVILACTELPLAINSKNSSLPIINPIRLQCEAAMDFALSGK